MDLGISGRRAICAGSSSGLGFEAALALAREGVDVLLSARGEEQLDAAADAIRARTGGTVSTVVANHAIEGGRRKLLEHRPDPDILVIASSPPPVVSDFATVTPSDWNEAMQSGFVAPIELIRAVSPGMVDRGWGRIVNISTLAAKQPAESRILSGAPRAALSNYTTTVSKKLARHNVVINNLLPGVFRTPGSAVFLEHLEQQAASSTSSDAVLTSPVGGWPVPANRFGEAAEFGPLCAMFCSDLVGYVTGTDLAIDGGMTTGIF